MASTKIEKMKLVIVNKEYCDYLRKYDNRVPYNNGNKMSRPFVGILFEIYDITYFAPLSSPKPKHLLMKNSIDFMKIDDGKLGAINFNNMIPIPLDEISVIHLNNCYSANENRIYKMLLMNQLDWINNHKHKICSKAIKLYEKQIQKKLSESIYNRCCDYKKLENYCSKWKNHTN